MTAAVKLYFDNRRTKDAFVSPVRFSIYFDGKQYMVASKYSCSKEHFDKWKSPPTRVDGLSKQASKELGDLLKKAETICESLGEDFTQERFTQAFHANINYSTRKNSSKLRDLFEQQIQTLENNDQFKYATSYKDSLKSIEAYAGSKMTIQDVTLEWVKGWDKWLKNKGVTDSTRFSYQRPLRNLFNLAIENKVISIERSPFGKKKFTIGSSDSARRFLTQEQLHALHDYVPQNEAQREAIVYSFFAFYCNGIAPVDLANLKKDNIHNNTIIFRRQKTSASKKERTIIQVPINSEMAAILKRIGRSKPQPYIFPILTAGMTAKERLQGMEKWKGLVNHVLARIGKKIGIERLSMYSARHTYGYTLNLHAVPVTHIQTALGHSKIEQTTNYIGTLPNSRFEELSNIAVDFVKKRALQG